MTQSPDLAEGLRARVLAIVKRNTMANDPTLAILIADDIAPALIQAAEERDALKAEVEYANDALDSLGVSPVVAGANVAPLNLAGRILELNAALRTLSQAENARLRAAVTAFQSAVGRCSVSTGSASVLAAFCDAAEGLRQALTQEADNG